MPLTQKDPLPLAIALQFYGDDMAKALRLARFLSDLEPVRHDDVALIFARRFDVPMSDELWRTAEYCSGKFNVAHLLSERERTGHPDGCFDLWASTAEQCYRHSLQDWKYDDVLFIEPDGVPTRSGWIEYLQAKHAETLALGKRITGSFMQGSRYYCDHIQGTHIMRLSCWEDHKSLRSCRRGVAWDVKHSSVFLAESSRSSAISNLYGVRNLTPEVFEVIGRESAWLPSAKDDSAWECAQGLLPDAHSNRRYRAVFVRQATGATVAILPGIYRTRGDVVLPTKIADVPDIMIGDRKLREMVGTGAAKLDIEQLDLVAQPDPSPLAISADAPPPAPGVAEVQPTVILARTDLADAARAVVSAPAPAQALARHPCLDKQEQMLEAFHEALQPPSSSAIDLVLVTYPGDFDWLKYLFGSLVKYVTGYRHLLILIEEDCPEPAGMPETARIVRRRSYRDAYPTFDPKVASALGAVIERLRAAEITDAGLISFMDSDCVFRRKTNYQNDPYIIPERPRLLWRTWEEAGAANIWKDKAAATLGYEPTRETMCGYPFTFPRVVLADFWRHVGGADGLVKLGDNFTDWNALGNWALDHHADAMTAQHAGEYWQRVNTGIGPTSPVEQFWSRYRPDHPKVQQQMRKLGLLTPPAPMGEAAQAK